MKEEASSGRSVQAVTRALALLDALGEHEENTLSALARRASLHPSTAHRLLASLIEAGYATQSPITGRYRLGRRVLELASGAGVLDAQLRTLARPHLEAIRAAID